MQVVYEGMKKAPGFDNIVTWKMLMKINHKTGTLHSNEKAHLLHTLYEQLTQGW